MFSDGMGKSRGAKARHLEVVDGEAAAPGATDAGTPDAWSTEQTLRLLVSNAVDYAIFILDPTGHVLTWNNGAQRIKGYRESEIVGRHFSVFYPEADIRAGKPQWELVVAAAEGRFEDEGIRVRKDGTTFWANVVITALRDPAGNLRGFGKVTRDVTARKLEEDEREARQREDADQLRLHAQRMANLERTKTEFLNLASHELRGPLSVARGYLSLLEDGSLTSEQFLEVAPLVSAKLAQMELLVRQMLETARLEADQFQLALTPADLRQLVQQQVRVFKPLLSEAHRLEVEVPEVPLMVTGDATRLGAVILNLLDNAVKYSPRGGLVHVVVTAGGGRAFVSVRDQGVGIRREDLPLLFTRFGRIDNPDLRNIGGTGLGLFLSREIARRHRGDILVESTYGTGSRFTLSVPLDPASAPAKP